MHASVCISSYVETTEYSGLQSIQM